MRHPLPRCVVAAALLCCGLARADVVSVSLRPDADALDTLDWRHARIRDLKAATFPRDAPLYATVELGFQEPLGRGFPASLFGSDVRQITVVVGAGTLSHKAYLLVDEDGQGVAIEPGADGTASTDSVSVVQAEKSPGPVMAARFGIPIWAPMPLDDHLEIAVGVSKLPSFGRQFFDDLMGAASARATGLVTGVAGEDAGKVVQKRADRALAWLQKNDEQLGRPILLKRLQACRDSPLTCGGVLGSQTVVVTEAADSPDVFASKYEVRDGLLRARAGGARHPDFAVFVRLQLDAMPRALFSAECLAAWQDESAKTREELGKRCPADGLATAHQAAFKRLREALAKLPVPSAPREDLAVRTYELTSALADACGRGGAQLPPDSFPCQSVRALLDGKPRQLRVLGEGLAKYRAALEDLAALPAGGSAVCQHQREFAEQLQQVSQEFLKVEPTCRFNADDVAHPLRCGGLPGVETLAAVLGEKRGALADACRQQNLCADPGTPEPALRMALDAVCRNGVRGDPNTFAMDTTPIIQVFEGAVAGAVKEPLDAGTAERVVASLRKLGDAGARLPATEPWSALLRTVGTRLGDITAEYSASRQYADELAEGETAAARQAARELAELAGPVRADSADALERTVAADLDELKKLPHPFAKLFRGGRDHFVPVLGEARELRVARGSLYRRLWQDLDAVKRRKSAAPPEPRLPDAAPVPAPAG